MTFEEFFAKKKIDLTALQQADHSLYEEFKKHYMAMGAKSFDHTKKFWFNKLRKSYRLEEILIEKKEVQQPIVKEQQVAQAEVASSGTTGFKPRFKTSIIAKEGSPLEAQTPDNRVEKTNESASNNDATAKPAGFKPRFKTGVTKPASPETPPPSDLKADENVNDATTVSNPTTEEAPTDLTTASTSKPAGFKPRFKTGVTKHASPETPPPSDLKADENVNDATTVSDPTTEETPADLTTASTSKPAGFKPRFRAGVTKPASPETPPPSDLKADENVNDATTVSDPTTEETPANLTTASTSKPAGFKPRFKAGVTKPASPETPPSELKADENVNDATTVSDPTTEETPADRTASVSKPAGFKPRFKAGVTKSASPETTSSNELKADENVNDATTVSDPTTEETPADLTASVSKPAGFKPRFKAGVTKSASSETPPSELKADENVNDATTVSDPTTEETPADLTASVSKPAGFKPRFKAGVTKVKNKDNE